MWCTRSESCFLSSKWASHLSLLTYFVEFCRCHSQYSIKLIWPKWIFRCCSRATKCNDIFNRANLACHYCIMSTIISQVNFKYFVRWWRWWFDDDDVDANMSTGSKYFMIYMRWIEFPAIIVLQSLTVNNGATRSLYAGSEYISMILLILLLRSKLRRTEYNSILTWHCLQKRSFHFHRHNV